MSTFPGDLRAFIEHYQGMVLNACRLLQERLNLEERDLLFRWHSRPQAPQGWLDEAERVSYYFHGIGCCVEIDKILSILMRDRMDVSTDLMLGD